MKQLPVTDEVHEMIKTQASAESRKVYIEVMAAICHWVSLSPYKRNIVRRKYIDGTQRIK